MTDYTAHMERGMQLTAALPDVMPEQASPRVAAIYQDIRETLRVPLVNQIFRTLANFPDYLESAWRGVRPIVRTRVFEEAADELRADAVLSPAPDPLPLNVDAMPGAAELKAFNDTVHYVLPKLLLISSVFELASFGGGMNGTAPGNPDNADALIPHGIADGTGKIELLKPNEADGQLRTLFDAIKIRHRQPLISSWYRGLANWPEFLEAAWDTVAPYLDAPHYGDRVRSLINEAESYDTVWAVAAVELPDDQRVELADILRAFRLKFIPEMMLEVALVKCALDGEQAARTSRFSHTAQ